MERPPTDATTEPTPPATEPDVAASATTPTATTPAASTASLAAAPPLALVAALSGLFATLLSRVLIPTRDPADPIVIWELASRIGAFAINLTALAGMAALVLGVLPWVRSGSHVSLRRRLLVATFSGMLLPVWLRAMFFPRDSMNGALAGLGAAAAYSLATLLVLSSVRGAIARPLRLLPVALAMLSTLCALTLLTLQSIAVVAPFSQVHRITWLVSDMGEAAYLGVLLCALTLLPSRPWHLRNQLALALGGFTAVSFVIAFWFAAATLGRDFAVALYYAQRVTWFLDSAIWIYALPLAIGIGASVTGALVGNPTQRQLAIAVMTWIGAGFAPRAPWRFTLLALSACLIARAVTSLRDHPDASA